MVTATVRPSFPLGTCIMWVSAAGTVFPATLVDGAIRYLIVAFDPDRAEAVQEDLETMRRELAVAAGWEVTANEPKIGCVAATRGARRALLYRVRQNEEQGWHPGMAASGILMLAAVAGTPGTVVAELLGGPVSGSLKVRIPGGGVRPFAVVPSTADGLAVTYGLSPVKPLLFERVFVDAVEAECPVGEVLRPAAVVRAG